MQDMIKQRPILSLLPMCTADAGLSIILTLVVTATDHESHMLSLSLQPDWCYVYYQYQEHPSMPCLATTMLKVNKQFIHIIIQLLADSKLCVTSFIF